MNATTDDNKETPLHVAASVASTSVIQKLLEAGADSTARDKNKETVLHKICSWRKPINGMKDLVCERGICMIYNATSNAC